MRRAMPQASLVAAVAKPIPEAGCTKRLSVLSYQESQITRRALRDYLGELRQNWLFRNLSWRL